MKYEIYPFTDVGMFRNRTVAKDLPNKVAQVKHYFYDKDSVVVIADIQGDRYSFNRKFPLVDVPPRRVLFTALADEENFEYLQKIFSPYTNKLFVGLQTYDFETGEYHFYTNFSEFEEIMDELNATRPFIPIYQLNLEK